MLTGNGLGRRPRKTSRSDGYCPRNLFRAKIILCNTSVLQSVRCFISFRWRGERDSKGTCLPHAVKQFTVQEVRSIRLKSWQRPPRRPAPPLSRPHDRLLMATMPGQSKQFLPLAPTTVPNTSCLTPSASHPWTTLNTLSTFVPVFQTSATSTSM